MNNLENMTSTELLEECKRVGVGAYGTKQAMIERIKAKMLSEVTAEDENPSDETPGAPSEDPDAPLDEPEAEAPLEEKKPAPNPNAPVIHIVNTPPITREEAHKLKSLPPVNHAKHVQETLQFMKDRYPHITVRYNSNDEVFTFEGGRQGRETTTAKQPLAAIKSAIEYYSNVARGRNRKTGTVGGNLNETYME